MSYSTQQTAQVPQQKPAFNLDDLLDLRTPEQRAAAAPVGAPLPPPSVPPPPPVNDDPYGFNALPPRPAAPYTYVPPAPQGAYPVSYATIPQPPQTLPQQLQPPPSTGGPYPPQPYYPPPQGSVSQPVTVPPPAFSSYPLPQSGHPTHTAQTLPSAYTQPYVPQAPPQQQPPHQPAPQAYAYHPTWEQQRSYPTVEERRGGFTQATDAPAPLPPATGATAPAVTVSPVGLGPQAAPQVSAADDEADRIQLEKIMRLRKELEREQERERQKREEKETWPCKDCTYRNKETADKCEMCGTLRPGVTPLPAARPPASTPPATQGSTGAPATAARVDSIPYGCRWQCSVCGQVNEFQAANCTTCNGFRANGTPVPGSSTTTTVPQPQDPTRPQQAQPRASAIPPGSRWQCSVCGGANEYQNANCSTCNGFRANGTPLPPTAGAPLPPTGLAIPTGTVRASSSGPAAPNANGSSPATAAAAATWECNVCTLRNSVNSAVCTACESGQRPRHLSPAASPAPQPSPSPYAPAQQPSSLVVPLPGVQPATKWPCSTCTFENVLQAPKCSMCGAARPAAFASLPGAFPAHPAQRPGGQPQPPGGVSTSYPAQMNPYAQPLQRPPQPQQQAATAAEDDDAIQWQADNAVMNCNKCALAFSLIRRRHHCRACGFVFCYNCCGNKVVLKPGGQPEKVCIDCFREKSR